MITLIQNASGPFVPLLEATERHHRKICLDQGIAYIASYGRLTDRHPNWDRFALIMSQIMGDLIWLDADALIMPDEPIRLEAMFRNVAALGMVQHHTTSWKDWGWHWNAGVMALKPLGKNIIVSAWNIGVCGTIKQPDGWVNQGPLHMAMEHTSIKTTALDPRWNWTPNANECANPFIKCWHGHGPEVALEAIRKEKLALGID